MKIGIISELTHKENYSDNVLYKILRRFNIPLRKIYFNEFKLLCIKHKNKKSIVCECDIINYKNAEPIYNIDVIAAEIPYSKAELKEFSDNYLKKCMINCLNSLRRMGIERILFTDGIKEIYATEQLSREMLGGEFSKAVLCNISEIVKGASLKCGINSAEERLGIVCTQYSKNLIYIMKQLVTEVKFIRIYTNESSKLSEICAEFYNSYGIFIEVFEYKDICSVNDTIVCDLDRGVLIIGRDVVIDDIKYCSNICKYEIKDIELIDIIDEKADEFQIKYCKAGKNRLTI